LRVVDLSHDLPARFSLPLESLDFHNGNGAVEALVTRIEAPAYLLEGGRGLGSFPLEAFINDAVILDLTHVKSGELIDDEDLEAAEEDEGLALREGEIAIINTGWAGHAASEEYWSNHPALSENGAEYLAFKRVVGVGIDTPNLDASGNKSLSVHSILMRQGAFVIENLCNLHEIDQSRFRLIALPLKLKADVSPARAVCVLHSPV
jgi:arylformamidase